LFQQLLWSSLCVRVLRVSFSLLVLEGVWFPSSSSFPLNCFLGSWRWFFS
jgi:hypothetical protein